MNRQSPLLLPTISPAIQAHGGDSHKTLFEAEKPKLVFEYYDYGIDKTFCGNFKQNVFCPQHQVLFDRPTLLHTD